MAAAAADLLRLGEVTTLATWLAALPAENLYGDEELLAHKALAALLTGQMAEAAQWANRLAEGAAGRADTPRSARSLAVRAWLASVLGQPDVMALARDAVALTSDDDPLYRTLALITLGFAQNVAGDMAGSDASFGRAYALSQAAGQSFAAMGALANLCFNLLDEGRFSEAAALGQEALAQQVDRRGRPLPVLGVLYVPLAVLAYVRDDLAQAETYASEGLALCRRLFSRSMLGGDAEMTLAQVYFARGDVQQALALLVEARHEAAAAHVTVVAGRLALQEAVLRLRAGDPSAVERTLAGAALPALAGSQADTERRQLLQARLLLARGRVAEARSLLAELAPSVAARGRYGRLAQICVLQAVAAQQAGDEPAAVESLRAALRLAAPEGHRRAFLDAGPVVAALLPLARSAAPEFVDDLLARFGDLRPAQPAAAAPHPAGSPQALAPQPGGLIEPLSERELEILRLIGDGQSNQAIADRLVITVGTAKWHISNIYGKLGVRSRTQALSRARELGLI